MLRLAALAVAAVTAMLTCSCASLIGLSESSQTSPGLHPLEFSARTIDGEYFSGQSMTGKPAVLWFWSPSCGSCQSDAPTIVRVAGAHPTVMFVGVGGRDQLPAIKEFVARYGLAGFTELADLDGGVWRHFEIAHAPAFAFIAATGATQIVRDGNSVQDLEARVEALEKAVRLAP